MNQRETSIKDTAPESCKSYNIPGKETIDGGGESIENTQKHSSHSVNNKNTLYKIHKFEGSNQYAGDFINYVKALPARYAFAIISSFGFFNVYAMRVNLSVAMVAMVGNKSEEHTNYGTIACTELLSSPHIYNLTAKYENATKAIIQNKDVFDWDSTTQSNILGSFFIGYVITQIPGGIIAEKYGAKLMFGVGVLITAIFTLLTPLAAHWGKGALIAARIIEGLGEGVTYPAMNALIGRWVPKNERSRISTIIFSGSPFGTVVSLAVSGYLSSSQRLGGWPMVFYLFGALGCVWFVFWMFLIYESPDEHPRISQSELDKIRAGQDQMKNRISGRTPWRAILTSGPLWALAVTHFGFNWGFYTLLTELPTYLSNILHFDLKHNGILSAMPYLCQALFAFIASGIADKMRESNRYRITFIRKLMNSIAFFIPCVLVASISVIGCDTFLSVTMIVLSVAFSGFMYSGFNVTHVDMSPEFAGTLMGITNCIANMAGFLAPAYVGFIIQDGQTLRNWGIVFLTTSAVYFVTGLVYAIFASAELQPWGLSSPQTDPISSQTGATDETREDQKILSNRTDKCNQIP